MSDYRHPTVSLRQLQYAVAVAQTGGFGTAAARCGVSQPALSAQIAKLEGSLSVQLFERLPRGVHLTRGGDVLIADMQQILGDVRDLEARASALADPYSVTLRVGVIPTVAPYLVPFVVDTMRSRDRAPRVHWIEAQTDRCEADLVAGDLDAMIIADPPTRPGLEGIEIGWEPFEVVVPIDHPFVGAVTLPQLAEAPLLLLEDGHCLRDQTMALCMQPGASESPYRATSLATLVQMVAAGLGITVLPASAIAAEVQRAHVRAVPLTPEAIGRTLHLIWRTHSAHTRMLAELADAVGVGFAIASGPARP